MLAPREPSAHGYSLAFGQMPLRQRIARFYDEWYGTHHIQIVAITVGSSTAFALAFLSAFDEATALRSQPWLSGLP